MPYFEDQRVIFVHIPRTGGQSVCHAFGIDPLDHPNWDKLYGASRIFEASHFTASEIRNLIGEERWKNCDSFTIIRNPFDRMVSEFLYKKARRDARLIRCNPSTSFLDFVEKVYSLWLVSPDFTNFHHTERTHFIPQVSFVFEDLHERPRQAVRNVYRFEEFDTVRDYVRVITGRELGHLNGTGKRVDYRTMYDSESRAMVEEMYAEDLDFLGYSYGD